MPGFPVFLLFFALLFPNLLQAEAVAPIVDLLPECKQKDSVLVRQTLKVRNTNLWRFAVLRDVPEVARYLLQMRENATARRFDAVMLLELKTSGHKTPGNYSEVFVQLELFRFCDGNANLSNTASDSSDAGGIKLDFGTLEIKTSVQAVLTPPRTEEQYKTVALSQLHVSLPDGAIGVKPGMTVEQVQALWGSPSADLLLQDGGRLLGYGRRLWVFAGPLVKAVFTDNEIFSGLGRNLLEFHPEFDDKPWLIDGKVAYKTDAVRAAQQLGSWQKVTPLQWRRQQATQQLTLFFDEFNPQSVDASVPLLTGFRLSSVPDKMPVVQLRQPAWSEVLAFVEALSVRNHHQQPKIQLLPDALRLHQLVQRRNLHWWLPTTQLHVLTRGEDIVRLKVTTPVLRKHDGPDQLPLLLKALQLPSTKAGLRLAFPDMQDYGDRFQLYRDDFDILIEFASDADQATIEQLEIIYHYPA